MSFKVEIAAGSRDRRGVLRVALPENVACQAGDVLLQFEQRECPGQITGSGELIAILDDIPAGSTQQVTVVPVSEPPSVALPIRAAEQAERIDVTIDGDRFLSYNYSAEYAKPFIAPIIGAYGDVINRPVEPSIREHPHQRGIFIAHGDVCGEEIWNEPEGRHGRCIQTELTLNAGCVAAQLITENTWQDRDGKPLMDETRTVTTYALAPELRIIDLDLLFRANHGEVRLGGTKEAGFLGIRMHPDINVNADKGGRMENCYGAVGEAECWSKRAHWCDYHGIVNGHRVGMAAFDNAHNPRFPTHWHIRDYGLFAANPWYWSGDYTIPAEDPLRFQYRVIVHAGDTQDARIAEQYIQYDVPPTVKFLD